MCDASSHGNRNIVRAKEFGEAQLSCASSKARPRRNPFRARRPTSQEPLETRSGGTPASNDHGWGGLGRLASRRIDFILSAALVFAVSGAIWMFAKAPLAPTA